VHEVDKDVFPLLTLDYLKEMGINVVGARRKIYYAIQKPWKRFAAWVNYWDLMELGYDEEHSHRGLDASCMQDGLALNERQITQNINAWKELYFFVNKAPDSTWYIQMFHFVEHRILLLWLASMYVCNMFFLFNLNNKKQCFPGWKKIREIGGDNFFGLGKTLLFI